MIPFLRPGYQHVEPHRDVLLLIYFALYRCAVCVTTALVVSPVVGLAVLTLGLARQRPDQTAGSGVRMLVCAMVNRHSCVHDLVIESATVRRPFYRHLRQLRELTQRRWFNVTFMDHARNASQASQAPSKPVVHDCAL